MAFSVYLIHYPSQSTHTKELHMFMGRLDYSNPTICHRFWYEEKQSQLVCFMQQMLS